MRKMKTILFIYSCMTLVSNCFGQSFNPGKCYIYKSDYYKGDFIKICINNDQTFYYQRHQNDVIPDYYSLGTWNQNERRIIFKSIEPSISNTSIIQQGNPITDTILLKLVDAISGIPLRTRSIILEDSTQHQLTKCNTDSLGQVRISMKNGLKYAKFQTYLDYQPITLNLDMATLDNVTVKCKSGGLIFQDISNIRIFLNDEDILTEEIEKGKFIYYHIEK